jgi:hypothetical protein
VIWLMESNLILIWTRLKILQLVKKKTKPI